MVELLGHRDIGTRAHLFDKEVSLQGREYLSVDIPITSTGWHYFRLVPTNKILAPLRQLFYALVAMVLATGLLVGFLIDVAVKRNIVNRLQILANAVRKYGLGELDARANLTGDDEIAKASQEFDAMAGQMKATLDALPDMLFEFGLDGTYHSVHTPTDDYLLEIGQPGAVRRDPRQPLGIADQDFGAGVGEAVTEFGAGPPSV